MKKKKGLDKEFKAVENVGICAVCQYFSFDPVAKDSHYYIGEDEAQGECIYDKSNKVGTMSLSRGCKHWMMKS